MKTENTSQTARVNLPHRTQMEMQLLSLEQMLPPDHRARDVWAFVSSLDLEPFYRDIEVTDDSPGRPAIAPEILVALWLLATQLVRHGKDPHERQRRDTDEYATFRARMADPDYQKLYKSRPSIAEFPNADCRNRNLRQFRVRGLVKVKAVALWHALAFNFLRLADLKVLVT